MEVRQLTFSEWGEELPSNGFEVFHTPEALRVLDEHAKGELQLFGGFKGDHAVGLLPVFVRDQRIAKAVVSPPPGLSVPRLGPVVMANSPKQSKHEKVNREFTESVLQALDADNSYTLFGLVTTLEYTDPRPYHWAGYDIEPRFAYVLDLEDTTKDDVLMSFSRDSRREIQDGEELDITVSKKGASAAMKVYDKYQERLAEQGIDFPTPRGYTHDLVTTLDDRARVYVAESPEGEFLSGLIILYSNDSAYSWMGGMRSYYEDVNVNSLIVWRIIEDIISDPDLESVSAYDFGNANIEKISNYKSKYNPNLVPHYEIKSGLLMRLAKKTYKALAY